MKLNVGNFIHFISKENIYIVVWLNSDTILPSLNVIGINWKIFIQFYVMVKWSLTLFTLHYIAYEVYACELNIFHVQVIKTGVHMRLVYVREWLFLSSWLCTSKIVLHVGIYVSLCSEKGTSGHCYTQKHSQKTQKVK